MSVGLIILIVVVVLVLLVGLWAFSAYNGLVRLRNAVDEAWAQIATQLQRRFDLIPNLVEVVKGYAKHEASTLEAVTQARAATGQALSSGSPASAQAAEKLFGQAMMSIQATAEAYPDLKASSNFLSLQEELSSTENKVSFARQAYNDSVFTYNNKVQTVPSNLIASMFHFATRQMFQVENEAEVSRAPKVQF